VCSSDLKACGNTFDHQSPSANCKGLNNYFAKPFNYYFYSGNPKEIPKFSSNVNFEKVEIASNCYTFFGFPQVNFTGCIRTLIFKDELLLKNKYADLAREMEYYASNSLLNEFKEKRVDYDVQFSSLVNYFKMKLSANPEFSYPSYDSLVTYCFSHHTSLGIRRLYEFWLEGGFEDSMINPYDSIAKYKAELYNHAYADSSLLEY